MCFCPFLETVTIMQFLELGGAFELLKSWIDEKRIVYLFNSYF